MAIFLKYPDQTNTPIGAPTPTSVFKFDQDAAHLTDRMGNSPDLYVDNGSIAYDTSLDLDGIISPGNLKLASNATATALHSTGAVTVELLAKYVSGHYLLAMANAGETSGANFHYSLTGNGTGNPWGCLIERGSGSNTFISLTAGTTGVLKLVTLTRSSDGKTYNLYENGSLVRSNTASNPPDGGSNNRLWLFASPDPGFAAVCTICGVRITIGYEQGSGEVLDAYTKLTDAILPKYYTLSDDCQLAKLSAGTVTVSSLGIPSYYSQSIYVINDQTHIVTGYDTSLSKVRVYYTENNWSSYSHLGATAELDSYGSNSYDVYAADLNDVWIVTNGGGAGWALHYDGANWTVKITATYDLYGMRGLSSDEVYFVGESQGFYMNFWKWDGVSAVQTTATSGMGQFTRSIDTVDGNTFWVRGNDYIRRAVGFNNAFVSQRYSPSAYYQTSRRVYIDDDGYVIVGTFVGYQQVVDVRTPAGSWSRKNIDSEGYLSSTKGAVQVTGILDSICAVHAGDDADGGPNFCISVDNGSNWTVYDIPGWDPPWPTASPRVTSVAALALDETAPAYTPISPTAGQSNVPVDSPIVVNITDTGGTGLSAASVILTVDGMTAWTGDTVQTGYTGSKSSITNGYQYTLQYGAPFTDYSTIVVGVYARDLAGNILNDSYSFTVRSIFAGMSEGQITVRSLAYSVYRIEFSQSVVITADLFNVANYTITAVDAGASVVTPLEVLGVADTEGTTSYVNLRVSRPTADALYRIEIDRQSNSDNQLLVNLRGYLRGRETKTDSVYKAFSQMYNTKTDSTLGQVLMAIGIEDDKIGGKDNESPIPTDTEAGLTPPTGTLSTYGSANFGTSTFGG